MRHAGEGRRVGHILVDTRRLPVKKYVRGPAIVGVLTLAVAAFGSKPTSGAAAGSANKDFKACMISDSGGFDDKSFNQTSLKGQEDAVTQFGIQSAKVQSTGDSQYADNINQMVQQSCNEITTVGFLLGDATLAAAKKNPDIDFAIVDYAYDKAPKNLKGLTYQTDQPSFLAGYLAAG